MMGYNPPPNDPLFSYHIQLETRVRKDHPLRKIKELIDFDFIYKEVEKTYGTNGNVSVPPPVILKLMLLLICYDVRSERTYGDTPRAIGLALVSRVHHRITNTGSQRALKGEKKVGRGSVQALL